MRFDAQALRRTRSYLTGPPSFGRLARRIRSLEVPNAEQRHRPPSAVAGFRISLAKITTPFGFSFDPDGWHPYVAVLQRWLAGDSDSRVRAPLVELYERFRPETVQEAILEHRKERLEPLCYWPAEAGLLSIWSLTPDRVRRALVRAQRLRSERQTRQFIGPAPDWFIEKDLERLIKLLQSIRGEGYRPEVFGAPPLSGYFLVRGQDYRFVCRHGNHRLAALSCLGQREVVVSVARRVVPIVRHDDLAWWSVERGGLYPSTLIEELFQKMFDETGVAKARALGMREAIRT